MPAQDQLLLTSRVAGISRRVVARRLLRWLLVVVAVVHRVRLEADPARHRVSRRSPTSTDRTITSSCARCACRAPLVGVMVGACLGLSGAIMQGLTRNPLADPGILGVDAGAALAVVIGIYVFDVGSLLGYVWFSFAGALVASLVVYGLGSAGRTAPRRSRSRSAGAALVGAARFVHVGDPAARHRDARPVPVLGRRLDRRAVTGDIARQVAPFAVVAVVLSLCTWRALTRSHSATTSRVRSARRSAAPRAAVLDRDRPHRGHRDGGVRADRFRRPRHPAHGPQVHRSGAPLAAAVLDGPRPDPAARQRHRRPRDRPPVRGPGRHRHRARRRAVLRAPSPAAPAGNCDGTSPERRR